MSDYLTRNQVVGAAFETTAGVAVPPAYATALVALEDVQAPGNFETVSTNEYTGGLDKSPDLPAGGTRPFKGTALLKGVGAAAAATGTPPAWGPLLEACAFGRTGLTAAKTGTVTALTATAATLSDVAGIVRGMPITVAGQRRVVAAVAASVVTVYPAFDPVPAANAAFAVPAGNVYRPISTGARTITLARWRRALAGSAKLDIIPGVAGTVAIELPVRGPGRLNFDLVGGLLPETEVADPGEPTFQPGTPLPWLGAAVYFAGRATPVTKLDVAFGGSVQTLDNPQSASGYDFSRVTERLLEIKVNPRLGRLSERDEFGTWLSRAPRDFWTAWGDTPGQMISIYCPNLVSKVGPEETDIKGVMHEGLTLQASERNAGLFLWVG